MSNKVNISLVGVAHYEWSGGGMDEPDPELAPMWKSYGFTIADNYGCTHFDLYDTLEDLMGALNKFGDEFPQQVLNLLADKCIDVVDDMINLSRILDQSIDICGVTYSWKELDGYGTVYSKDHV